MLIIGVNLGQCQRGAASAVLPKLVALILLFKPGKWLVVIVKGREALSLQIAVIYRLKQKSKGVKTFLRFEFFACGSGLLGKVSKAYQEKFTAKVFITFLACE